MTLTNLDKTNTVSTVFGNIYDRLNTDVTSVTITGSVVVTIQTYTNSFNENLINSKSNYPILILNSPETEDSEDFTFTKKRDTGTFTIDILTTQKEAADKFVDAIKDSIETYRDDLRGVGMESVNFRNTTTDDFTRGKFTIHSRSITFEYKFTYTKTKVY